MGTNMRLIISNTKATIMNEAGIDGLGEEYPHDDLAKQKAQDYAYRQKT